MTGHPVVIDAHVKRWMDSSGAATKAYRSGELGPALARLGNPSGRAATERQVLALQRLGVEGDAAGLSFEQASAMLSAKAYAEGAIHSLIKMTDGYPAERRIEAELMAFVIGDDALRDRVVAWNKRRLARGTTGAVPMPKRDKHFARVQAEACRLLREHAGWSG